VFGTLIALLYKGKPILGLIDQPILKERWIGMNGRRTKLNGEDISTRSCPKLSQAYLYTTSPHLFSEEAEKAYSRVRDKVLIYLCNIYILTWDLAKLELFVGWSIVQENETSL
jgi:inositol-phosphate phosphatase/L-galactose 1-phosphate phosphatase/histidinol-phosphatase